MSRHVPLPSDVVAAAERTYHAMRGELARFLPMVQGHLERDGSTEVETVCHVLDTMLRQDRGNGALLAACAIVELAKRSGQQPHHHGADKRRDRSWGPW